MLTIGYSLLVFQLASGLIRSAGARPSFHLPPGTTHISPSEWGDLVGSASSEAERLSKRPRTDVIGSGQQVHYQPSDGAHHFLETGATFNSPSEPQPLIASHSQSVEGPSDLQLLSYYVDLLKDSGSLPGVENLGHAVDHPSLGRQLHVSDGGKFFFALDNL
ncbi:hypothetical protein PGTUg99_017837 [Puccinia graminis f. sp. tritici]|uniref:Uncharacterized protein n=1 Tax=Puccinia graminis f. sp. tritici TaxID=56615 RepID=A0A5B0QLT9_PUCGR|nr:hypothetical protein PGTUg99_017837 [Puccinia graminis f. sp. tritici]